MDDYHEWFGVASGVVSLCAYIWLVIEWRRGWKPQRATWTIWVFVTGFIAASMIASGKYYSALIPAGYCVGSAIIASLSFVRGEGKWDALNTWCVITAATGLVLWGATDNPATALFFNMVADFSAGAPTFRRLFKDPSSESTVGWSIFLAGALLGIPAIKSFTFIEAGYTLFITPFILTILLLTLRRPKTVRW